MTERGHTVVCQHRILGERMNLSVLSNTYHLTVPLKWLPGFIERQDKNKSYHIYILSIASTLILKKIF